MNETFEMMFWGLKCVAKGIAIGLIGFFVIITLLAFLTGVAFGSSPPIIGTVTKVSDADTYTIEVKVRVRFIDAPELKQPHGKEAADYARELLVGRKVELVNTGRSYDRNVAEVTIAESDDWKDNRRDPDVDIARHMTELGHAMLDPRYKPPQILVEAQDHARWERKGIWKGADGTTAQPEPPWEFRRRGQTNGRDKD